MSKYDHIKGTTEEKFEVNSIGFDPAPVIADHVEGRIYYDSTWKTLSLDSGSATVLQIGQEDWRRVTNNTGKTISNGVLVYTNGVDAGMPTVARAKADSSSTAFVLGMTTETITNGSNGMVTIRGNVNGLDTNKIGASYLTIQGILFHAKVGGAATNNYSVEIVNTGSGGLGYSETSTKITIDLGGSTSSSAQVVALFTATPSAIVNVREITATTPIVVTANTAMTGGVDTAEGDVLYLSEGVDGFVTTVVPEAPNLEIRIGRLITKDSIDGRINIRIVQAYRLNDIADVSVPSPVVDDVLKYDGNDWVAGSGVTVSGAMGVEFFSDDTSILAAGTNNSHKVESLVKTPSAIGQQVETWTTTSPLVLGEAYLYNAAITRDKLDAGTWTFDIYCSTSSVQSSPQLDQNIYRVIQGVGTLSTVRTSTTIAVTQTATTGLFESGDATADLSTCGYLQTPQGLYEITGFTNTKVVSARCLATYADETNIAAGNWKIWRKLFGVNTGNITNVTPAYGLVSKQSVQPKHTLTADLSDRLGSIMFARSTNTSRVISYVHNGANYASHFQTPLITLHNNLAGLNLGDYQHLSAAQKTIATQAATASQNGYATSTQITKLDGIEAGATKYPDTGEQAFLDADHSKLDGIEAGANAYTHPSGDGNLHVPATSTTNNGKVLTAGATAGSLSWSTPSSGGHTIVNESSSEMTARSHLQFAGSGVAVTDSAGSDTTVVTISGSSAYPMTLSKSFMISSPTADADGPVWRTPDAIVITGVHVLCIGGTSITGQLWEYDSNGANGSAIDSTDITSNAGANANDDGSLTNSSVAAGNYIGWKTTSVSGSPTYLVVTFEYITTTQSKSFAITNPTADADMPIWRAPCSLTITGIHVLCIGGTNVVGQLWEYDANGANGETVDSSDITATAGTNVNDDGTLSNPGIASGNYIGWKTTSVSGDVTQVLVTFDYVTNNQLNEGNWLVSQVFGG